MRLKDACSSAKKALSASKAASIEVEALIGDVDFSAQLSRAAFDELLEASGKLDTITEILEEALVDEANLTPEKSKIHSVLMIGGGSNIPKVKDIVEGWFKEKKFGGAQPAFLTGDGATAIIPEEAVAMGAAIQADLLLNHGDTFGELKTTCNLAEEEPTAGEDEDDEPAPGTIAMSGMVLEESLGVTLGADFFPVLLKGSAVPCSKKQKFGVQASWANATLDVCEKSGAKTKKLAQVCAPTHGKGHVDVEFKVSEDGVLSIVTGDKTLIVKK